MNNQTDEFVNKKEEKLLRQIWLQEIKEEKEKISEAKQMNWWILGAINKC